MAYFAILLGIVVPALALERFLHRRSRRSIAHRIHVNGIRGKSSVTRLIAAGLRADGRETWAKVTGTEPRIVDGSGREVEVWRMNGGSLGEQRTVVALAARAGVDALVIECMALQPQYQEVAEDGFIRSTVGVITNVRPDHLEVFGDRMESVAHALSATIPYDGVLFTTPGPAVPIFERVAAGRNSSVTCVSGDDVDERAMQAFGYVEHAENVALALAVCAHLGVDRSTALAAMAHAQPDLGVLRIFEARRPGQRLHVINALAANDPASTLHLYERFVAERWDCPLFVFVNSRRDRPLRSIQLGQLLVQIPADRYFVAGNDSRAVRRAARDAGVAAAELADCARLKPPALREYIFSEAGAEAVLFAIGNTGGGGLEVVEALDGRDA